jgi:geranylgeranyl reductase family protein
MFDCIIIGAGPAGSAAAYHLAKRGAAVLILEQAHLPRYRPCGGGVSPQIAEWFDFDFSPAIALKVDAICYSWKLEDPVRAKLETPEPFWLVQRDEFDYFLTQQAQSQGATLQDQTEVTGLAWQSDRWSVTTSQGGFEASYLIAADGAKGPMAGLLKFPDRRSRLASTLDVKLAPGDAHNPEANFEFGLVNNGYIWKFPTRSGYSISVSTFRGSKATDFSDILREYARSFQIQPEQYQQYDHPLCTWDGRKPLHTHHAVLAGEAASTVDPFTGEGIRPSMWSGIKAADAIASALGGDLNALEDYSKTLHETWGADMVWAKRIAGVFYRVPGVGYKVGIKRPTATTRMGQIMCGNLHYSDVAGRALRRMTGGLLG